MSRERNMQLKRKTWKHFRWAMALFILFSGSLLVSCSGTNYPYISSSKQERYLKKKKKKYGRVSPTSIPVKSNYKIKE